jgi:flagella synthesis protein FlgN
MRLSSDQQNRLAGLLAAELSETSRLQEILLREFNILGGNDPEQIGAISKEKLAQMQRMAQQLTARDDFLRELGLPKGKEGTDLLLQGLPRESELLERWAELLDIGKQLKQQNEINGNIVAVSQRQARQALDIISGKTGTPQTYGRGGETRSTTQQNSLAKA